MFDKHDRKIVGAASGSDAERLDSLIARYSWIRSSTFFAFWCMFIATILANNRSSASFACTAAIMFATTVYSDVLTKILKIARQR